MILTTVPPDLRALRGRGWSRPGVDVLDRAALPGAALLRRLLRSAGAYDAIVLNGSSRLDEVAAALLARRRCPARIVIGDCTWRRGTWWLDRLACRAGLRAIDAADVTYCVLSTDELALFPGTWGVDPSRVAFTPFCYTLADDELAAPASPRGGIFSGGDSMRDYGPLIGAAARLGAPLTLAVRRTPRRLPANVRATRTSHARFVELMRAARVVVVPLRPEIERSAGQQTYLNAMALGKLVIATDSPGARDYIDDGATGLVVPPADEERLASALAWALDPAHTGAVAEIGARARAVARSRFRPDDHLAALFDVAAR